VTGFPGYPRSCGRSGQIMPQAECATDPVSDVHRSRAACARATSPQRRSFARRSYGRIGSSGHVSFSSRQRRAVQRQSAATSKVHCSVVERANSVNCIRFRRDNSEAFEVLSWLSGIPAKLGAEFINRALCLHSFGLRPSGVSPGPVRDQSNLIAKTARSYKGRLEHLIGLRDLYLGLAAAALPPMAVPMSETCAGVHRLTCRHRRGLDSARFRCSQSRPGRRRVWPGSKWLRPSAPGHGHSHRGTP